CARRRALVVVAVAVPALVVRAAEDIRAEAAAHGGTVTVRGDFVAVIGDEVLLRQGFNKLCLNAIEACTEAGIAPQIVIEGLPDLPQHVLRLSVIDNGPGVEPRLAARVFQ